MTNPQDTAEQRPGLPSSSLDNAPAAWAPTGADLPSYPRPSTPAQRPAHGPANEPIRYIAPPPMPGNPAVSRPLQTGALPARKGSRKHAVPGRAPKKQSWFFRFLKWRVILGIGGLAIGGILSIGSTSASSLGPGDCFEDPGFDDISSVDDQDCDEPHDYEVFAVVSAPRFSSDPNAFTPECSTRLDALLPMAVATNPSFFLPDDAILTEFVEVDSGSRSSSGGDVLCAIYSPSGQLVGSIVP